MHKQFLITLNKELVRNKKKCRSFLDFQFCDCCTYRLHNTSRGIAWGECERGRSYPHPTNFQSLAFYHLVGILNLLYILNGSFRFLISFWCYFECHLYTEIATGGCYLLKLIKYSIVTSLNMQLVFFLILFLIFRGFERNFFPIVSQWDLAWILFVNENNTKLWSPFSFYPNIYVKTPCGATETGVALEITSNMK